MRKYFLASTSLAVVGLLIMSSVPLVSAQSGNDNGVQGNGLRVSPVRSLLNVAPGGSTTVNVTVENVTNNPAELQAVVNDFIAGDDESGQPRLLMDDKDEAKNNGLKRYVAKIPDVSLKPKQSANVPVTINIPSTAAAGGYYGAVRFVPKGTDTDSNVSLTASVGSLMLVTVSGDLKEQLDVASLRVSKKDGKASTFFTDGNNLQATVRFKNSGSAHTEPFGKVLVKKGGETVNTIEVNSSDPRATVLPNTVRRFTVELGDKSGAFGKYTVEGNFGYGPNGKVTTDKATFWVVPWAYIIGAVIFLLLIAALVLQFHINRKGNSRKFKIGRKK